MILKVIRRKKLGSFPRIDLQSLIQVVYTIKQAERHKVDTALREDWQLLLPLVSDTWYSSFIRQMMVKQKIMMKQ